MTAGFLVTVARVKCVVRVTAVTIWRVGIIVKVLLVREATRKKKQLDFGFLLNRLDPHPPLDLFFLQPHIKQAKVPQKVLVRPPSPLLFLVNVQAWAEKFLKTFGLGLDHPLPPGKCQKSSYFFVVGASSDVFSKLCINDYKTPLTVKTLRTLTNPRFYIV